MTRERTTRKVALVAVVAMLAVGTSAALAFGAGAGETNANLAQETTETAQETTVAEAQETTAVEQTTMAETANVTFANQSSNGSAVVVEQAVLPEGGFVVIHAAENATPEIPAENETEFEGVTQTETTVEEAGESQEYAAGEVLGNSTYLESGTAQNVTVELDQPLDESQVLIAMAHQDTNDNQEYEFPEADGPYTQDDQPVTDWANVTVDDGAGETMTAADTTAEDETGVDETAADDDTEIEEADGETTTEGM